VLKPKTAEKSDSTHPKRQHESTRERVLEAAFTLFCEHGFSDVSLLEIATRAQVSKRDLYACRCPKPLLSLEDRHPSFLIVYRKLLVYLGTLTGAPIPSTSQHKPQSQERNPTPKAESAFSQLSQWLNRTLRSIVPKTLEELFAGNSIH
jgi:hypothetical protein